MIGRRDLLDDWCLLICLADRRDQSCGRKTDRQHSRKSRWSLPDERGVATTPTDRRMAKHALLPIAAVAQQKRGCSSTNSSDKKLLTLETVQRARRDLSSCQLSLESFSKSAGKLTKIHPDGSGT
jgi:hypothetical protein